jgi:hypothetical protein
MKSSRSLQLHEDYAREPVVVGPSDRSFGLTFAVVFSLVGSWPLPWGGEARLWALALAAAFLLTAFLFPAALGPANRLWLRFGLLLHKIATPVILGAIFFLVLLPIGLLLRLLGKRPLQLHFDRDSESYWVRREAPGEPTSMRNQF